MKPILLLLVTICPSLCLAQTAASDTDPLKALRFLEGTWSAKSQGDAAVNTSGKYVFERELNGHVLARHSTSDPNCKGPASFDCEHRDLLYVFQYAPGQSLKAIYFDSEGHVIRYNVSTPTPTSVVFLSEASAGPRFRLTYERRADTMDGKFQMHAPGRSDWRSYLEWSGARE